MVLFTRRYAASSRRVNNRPLVSHAKAGVGDNRPYSSCRDGPGFKLRVSFSSSSRRHAAPDGGRSPAPGNHRPATHHGAQAGRSLPRPTHISHATWVPPEPRGRRQPRRLARVVRCDLARARRAIIGHFEVDASRADTGRAASKDGARDPGLSARVTSNAAGPNFRLCVYWVCSWEPRGIDAGALQVAKFWFGCFASCQRRGT